LERIEEQKSATKKFFSGLMKKIDTLLDDEEENQKQPINRINKTLAQSIVFSCQASFISYFVGMRRPFE